MFIVTSLSFEAHSRQEPATRALYRGTQLTSPQGVVSFQKALIAEPARASLVEVLSYPRSQTQVALSSILDHTPNLTRIYLDSPSYSTLATVSRRSGDRLQGLIASTAGLSIWTSSQLSGVFGAFKTLRVLELTIDIVHDNVEKPGPTTFNGLRCLRVLIIRSPSPHHAKPGVTALLGFLSLITYVTIHIGRPCF